MPRTSRAVEGGLIYHVLNRGNGRMRLFHKPADYEAFERVLAEGLDRYPVELFTYCRCPTIGIWWCGRRPTEASGRWMGWVGVTHVRRHHEHYHSRGGGHLYQGRFQEFSRCRRRVLSGAVPLRRGQSASGEAGARAEQWPWSGLGRRAQGAPTAAGPLAAASAGGLASAGEPQSAARAAGGAAQCVNRGRPWGDSRWVQTTARRLGLQFTLRGPGRPPKE